MTTCQRIAVRTSRPRMIVQPIGARGLQGIPGTPGTGGDLNDTFTQASASAAWVITHALGKYPSVETVDSLGRRVYGVVVWDSLTQITVTFSAAISGKAFLN